MAYYSSGKSNDDLVKQLSVNGLIRSERVAEAFRKVDRKDYVLDPRDAYYDMPQPIKCNATISAPHMHASATENLLPFLKPGARVLDVGSGSGYLCAVLHHLVTPDPSSPDSPVGHVIGIDHMPELVEWSVQNLKRGGLSESLEQGQIEMVTGDGRKGWPPEAPFDAIHVGAAAPTLPKDLVDQLKAPGRMFIPVGTAEQVILQVDKDEKGHIHKKKLLDVRYVPLTDVEDQRRGFF